MSARRFAFFSFAAFALAAPARADDAKPAEATNPFANIKFQEGPLKGSLEDLATVEIPAGMAFVAGRAESAKFMEATQNLVSHEEVGIIVSTAEGEGWWMSFEFDSIGYVKDDEKGKLDSDAILKSLTEGTEQGNAERRKRGWDELHVVGWHTPPQYNPATHNLEWATHLRSTQGENINYNVRLLGRQGVMSVTLIADGKQLEAALPKMRELLTGFAYLPDKAYAAYKPGDKVAKYGLTALVVGGTLAVAAKTGLLAKLWKVIAAGVVAIGAFLRKLFGGQKRNDPSA